MSAGPGRPAGRADDGAPDALVAREVVKRYGSVLALDRVELTVGHGECLALVGESGSGKTTLLRCFNRLVTPDGGSVEVRGRDVSEGDAVRIRRSVGYVQQEGGLLPHWTVLRNAALVPTLEGMDDAGTRAAHALERVGLPPDEFGARWPRELSGGQRQRVALARALAHGPDVILLDEPFGALDALTRADVQAEFRALIDELGVTALLVTHDLHEAVLLADRIAVMREGRVEQVAAPDTLRRAPATPYVRALLDRVHLLEGAGTRGAASPSGGRDGDAAGGGGTGTSAEAPT